ncbi:MAG TPA: hypothetical protein VH186_01560 [Chloroflexia bacterium]|nr:hypothetical protein [Chloroflexia bacterium]
MFLAQPRRNKLLLKSLILVTNRAVATYLPVVTQAARQVVVTEGGGTGDPPYSC